MLSRLGRPHLSRPAARRNTMLPQHLAPALPQQCSAATAAAAAADAATTAAAEPARRHKRSGYIGQGNAPAGEYYSCDFDWEEHMQQCMPLLEKQLAQAAALQAAAAAASASAAAGERGADGQSTQADDPSSGTEPPGLSARARRRLRNAQMKQQRRQQQREEQERQKAAAEASLVAAENSNGNGNAVVTTASCEQQLPPTAPQDDSNDWEVFFRAHQSARFFRERRYLALSFPCLAPPSMEQQEGNGASSGSGIACSSNSSRELSHIVELGAGCGSSILPLLKLHPGARATVCDVSATCLQQLRAAAAAEGIASDRVTAFVADATDPSLAARLASDPGDAVLIMFTLSAVPPGDSGMLAMLRNAAAALRPGGRLCIRDHGLGDMVQMRIPPEQVVFGDKGDPSLQLAESSTSGSSSSSGSAQQQQSADSSAQFRPAGGRPFWYKRGDGTLAYFYRKEELAAMGAAAGLVLVRSEYATVVNRNRSSGRELRRVFVQAVFERPEAL